MKLGSLYSGGIDAFAYAANRLGIEVAWHVESDKRAHRYLKQNYGTKIYNHDTQVGKRNLEWVDIIAGGDPCQPHSNAGLRRGKADNRYRWPEMLRIVREMRPTWIINENVAGSVSNMVFDQKVADLEKSDYSWQAYNIPAVAVGAHHERKRIFIIAHANEQGRQVLLQADALASFEASTPPVTLGAQGNAFLQFENSVFEPPLFPVANGLSNHIFRLEAAGNTIAAPIPIILLNAIKTIAMYENLHPNLPTLGR
jgi:DNA (cytosine-5)-methyltransferase 1